jgi:type II secretory pathway component PulM
VQTEKLPSLKRLRSARKSLQRIKARIAEVQGPLSAEEIASRARPATPVASAAIRPGLTEPMAAPPVIAPDDNRAGP